MNYKMTKDKSLEAGAIDFKGKKYVLVSSRVLYFNETYPEGSITSELVSAPSDELVVIKATVRTNKNPNQAFTGYSQAKWGDGYINKTSAIENAETSAVGRALAFMGIGVIESIASVDEINKAQTYTVSTKITTPVAPLTLEQALERCKIAIEACLTLKEIDTITQQIKASKIIPNRQSAKGKEIQDELKNLLDNKARSLIDAGELPFTDED